VHGEYAKLRHVINNASGALRPAVEQLASGSLTAKEQQQLLAVIYYPRETISHLRPGLIDSGQRSHWVCRTLELLFALARSLALSFEQADITSRLPTDFTDLFTELMRPPESRRPEPYLASMLEEFTLHDLDFAAVRAAARLVRNLSAHEIIVDGDLGDRGPRIDRVIDLLIRQPNVSLIWGNHDASWMGACLGNLACIATVLRFSLRYRRLSQLEEGYGITLQPLEKLARDVYGADPCENFESKGDGLRDDQQIARMQKAIAIIQLKLEGQLIEKYPAWNLASRNLLPAINLAHRTVTINQHTYPLTDTLLPTLDPASPNALSPEEQACMDRLRESFVTSARLWQHMSFVVRRGSMYLTRDDAVIFHACVPIDAAGQPLALEVDGRQVAGRELFDALAQIVRRAFRHGADSAGQDTDWFWYLWCGPRSPLFGKDKITTFESYFVADKHAKEETKNPYFEKLHDASFAAHVASLFGGSDHSLVVNGHVPVKIEKGELPIKRGQNAVTIDGAFSEAYGDKGYTLVLQPRQISLAQHTHFAGIQQSIETGADILPTWTTVRSYPAARTIADTPEGNHVRDEIAQMHRLIQAYRQGLLPEIE
jgi:fructose-1,6-bisphosphatase-3